MNLDEEGYHDHCNPLNTLNILHKVSRWNKNIIELLYFL